MTAPHTVIFDLGNVLVDWDPHRLYRQLIEDPAELSRFLAEVCTPEWHDRQDRGGSELDATTALIAQHPHQADLIAAFYGRWWEMFGPMPASVDVVKALRDNGIRLLALTNWPRGMFTEARNRYEFLQWFDGIVVSGEEGVAKPDEEIFRVLLERYGVDPSTAMYVDDKPQHVATARRLGLDAVVFDTPARLREDLAARGVAVDADVQIRPGERDDLPMLTDIYNNYVVRSAATFDLEPFSVSQREEWFEHYARAGRHRLLVATAAGRVIGYATSSSFRTKSAYDPTVETTIYLHADAGGRGIGSMLYQELFRQLATEDVHRAFAGVALPNDGSVALHRRFGFSDVGVLDEVGRKFDAWWDVLWMQRRLP